MSTYTPATMKPANRTTHVETLVEPADQGGETYYRCRVCGREALDLDDLLHRRLCLYGGEQ